VQQVRGGKRAAPVQSSAVPWLDDLTAREGDSLDPNGLVIRTSPSGGPRTKAAITALARRNDQSYFEDLKKRKGADADRPHRIAYKKLVRA
jgi:hypothetical protein